MTQSKIEDDTPSPAEIALGRLVWADKSDQVHLAGLLDPAHFLSKASRALFLLIAGEVDKGVTPMSLNPVVRERIPFAIPLWDRLIGSVGTESAYEVSSNEALAEAVGAHARTAKLKKALVFGIRNLAENGYAEARSTIDRHLTSIDLASLDARSFDDRHVMAESARAYLRGEYEGGLTFGLAKLDARVMPTLPGNFVVIGGRPGTGKSTWLRNWTRHFVKNAKEPTAYFSFEMTGDEKLPLFACMTAGVPYSSYIRRTMRGPQLDVFDLELAYWESVKHFWLNERSDVTPSWILRTMKRYRAEGVTTFVLDHLHRVRYARTANDGIRLSVGDFARDLKSFANDTASRVIVGAQYTKGDKHEEPGDQLIKEAGEIIAEADKIFHTWLPLVAGMRTGDGSFIPTQGGGGRRILAADAEKNSELGEDPTRAFLLIGKQRARSGDGMLSFPFNHETGLISDLEADELARAS